MNPNAKVRRTVENSKVKHLNRFTLILICPYCNVGDIKHMI